MPGADMYSMAANVGLQSAVGVAQLIQAGKQNREAKKLSDQLVRPDYQIPQEYKDNQALAEAMASQGLSDAARSVYERNANNSLTASVDAILRGGGSVNNVADLFNSSADNFASLAAIEDELRTKRQAVLMDQNESLGQQAITKWQVNEYAPYQDNKQLIAKLRQQANDNKWRGINTIASAVGGAGSYAPIAPEIGAITGTGGGGATPFAATSVSHTDNFGTPGFSENATTARASNYANIYSQEMLNHVGKNLFIQ